MVDIVRLLFKNLVYECDIPLKLVLHKLLIIGKIAVVEDTPVYSCNRPFRLGLFMNYALEMKVLIFPLEPQSLIQRIVLQIPTRIGILNVYKGGIVLFVSA